MNIAIFGKNYVMTKNLKCLFRSLSFPKFRILITYLIPVNVMQATRPYISLGGLFKRLAWLHPFVKSAEVIVPHLINY